MSATEEDNLLTYFIDHMELFCETFEYAMLWTHDKLKEVFGLDDIVAKYTRLMMFWQIIVISAFVVVLPSAEYPKETILFLFCLLFFLFVATSISYSKKKLETAEKEPIDEKRSTDKKKFSTMGEFYVHQANKSNEKYQRLELSSRYHSLLKSHNILEENCIALTDQNGDINSRYHSLLKSHKILEENCKALTEQNRDLNEKSKNHVCYKQTGMPPSTEAPHIIEKSKDKGIQLSTDPERVKFTIETEAIQVAKIRADTESIKSVADLGYAKILDENMKSDAYIRAIDFLEDPKNVNFPRRSEVAKFLAGGGDIKFIENGQDLESGDPKEGEWEIVDA